MSHRVLGPMFHGTDAILDSGDVVEPRSGIAWATDQHALAQAHAREKVYDKGGVASVYSVEPLESDDLEERSNVVGDRVFTSKRGFRVTGLSHRFEIPPPVESK